MWKTGSELIGFDSIYFVIQSIFGSRRDESQIQHKARPNGGRRNRVSVPSPPPRHGPLRRARWSSELGRLDALYGSSKSFPNPDCNFCALGAFPVYGPRTGQCGFEELVGAKPS